LPITHHAYVSISPSVRTDWYVGKSKPGLTNNGLTEAEGLLKKGNTQDIETIDLRWQERIKYERSNTLYCLPKVSSLPQWSSVLPHSGVKTANRQARTLWA